jgi:hypothetical protein
MFYLENLRCEEVAIDYMPSVFISHPSSRFIQEGGRMGFSCHYRASSRCLKLAGKGRQNSYMSLCYYLLGKRSFFGLIALILETAAYLL